MTHQTREKSLTELEGIQEVRYHMLELHQEPVLSQYSGEHRCIKILCIVGHQQYGALKGTKVMKEGGENIMKRNSFDPDISAKQVATMNSEACGISGTIIKGA